MAADLDYTKLTRQQKLAVFLIVIGPESAADVHRHFDDADIELICREMSALKIVPQSVQKLALEEFSKLVAQSTGSALGGLGYAQRTLAIAKGDYQASAFVGRVGPAAGKSTEIIREISEMEGRQIFNLLKNEQPQTISFLLSYLDTQKSAEVFGLLSPEVREEVIERLGTIESTSEELAGKIARRFGKPHDTKSRTSFHNSDGVRAVADLLNQLDKDTSKNLLARLEERNATLSTAVRKKLFSFEDLNRLQPADLQRVLREVDSSNLSISMKSASEGIRERIYGAISKRAAEALRDEVQMLGPIRVKDVDIAQEAIIQVVRRLEEEGQITLDSSSADGVVA